MVCENKIAAFNFFFRITKTFTQIQFISRVTVFLDVMPCSLVSSCHGLGAMCYLSVVPGG
jgi:hypothetical protein